MKMQMKVEALPFLSQMTDQVQATQSQQDLITW